MKKLKKTPTHDLNEVSLNEDFLDSLQHQEHNEPFFTESELNELANLSQHPQGFLKAIECLNPFIIGECLHHYILKDGSYALFDSYYPTLTINDEISWDISDPISLDLLELYMKVSV